MDYTQPMVYKISAFDVNSQDTIPELKVGFTGLEDIPDIIEGCTVKVYNNNTGILITNGTKVASLYLDSFSNGLAVYTCYTSTGYEQNPKVKILSEFIDLSDDTTLSNGNSYYITITVQGDGDPIISNGVIFSCYLTPEFYDFNINNGQTITQNAFRLNFDYRQIDGVELNWYQCELFNNLDIMLKDSGKLYDENYTYTFDELTNTQDGESYYIKVVGNTVDNFSFQYIITGVTVSYAEIQDSSLIELENVYDEGYIKINTSYEEGTVIDNISYVLIKRKELNGIDWITLVKNPVNSLEDLVLEHHDYFNKNGVTYQYAVVQVDSSGVESPYEEKTIKSCFNKVFIVDEYNSYDLTNATNYNSYQRNQQTGIYETFGRKYPITVMNSVLDYYSMTTTAYLIKDNSTNNFDYIQQRNYIDEFTKFLNNKKAKILKDYNGNIWLLTINGAPTIEPVSELGNSIARISFNWVEIGDANQEEYLKSARLIPVKPIYSQIN